jgi:hypothetical protein
MSTLYYLAEHPDSGKALFTRLPEAKRWLEYQHDYHRDMLDEPQDVAEAANTRWVDGGVHGWHSLVSTADPRRSFAGITELVPDREASRNDVD